MLPKSTTALTVGDVCFIPRQDGQYVPFVFVAKRGNERAYLIGAFADVVVEKPDVAELPVVLKLREHALLHIKCYRENNTPIIGNVRGRLDETQLSDIAKDILSPEVGQTSRVWGWRTLIAKANSVEAL